MFEHAFYSQIANLNFSNQQKLGFSQTFKTLIQIMQSPAFKKGKLQLKQDLHSQTKLNQMRQVKNVESNSSTNRTQFFTSHRNKINIPQPKRGIKQISEEELQRKQSVKSVQFQKVSKIVKGILKIQENGSQSKRKNKDANKNSKKIILNKQNKQGPPIASILNVREDQFFIKPVRMYNRKNKSEHIGQSLSYFLAQNSVDKGDKLQQPMKTVYEWENKQIRKFVQDPNLGDFIIKFPNPQNLSKQYFDLYPQAQSQQKKVQICYEQALQFYKDMFNVEGGSKKTIQRQTQSFLIAYYLLDFQSNFNQTKKKLSQTLRDTQFIQAEVQQCFQFVHKQVDIFLIVLNYYVQIQEHQYQDLKLKRINIMDDIAKALSIYIQMIEKQKQVQSQPKSLRQIFEYKNCFHSSLRIDVLQKEYQQQAIKSNRSLLKHKKNIFQNFLVPYVQTQINKLFEGFNLGYNVISTQLEKAKAKYTLLTIFNNLEKISIIFTYFMNHGGYRFIQFIHMQFKQKGSLRKLLKGKNLQKIVSGYNMLWVNNKCRPKDTYTLLRNCLVYQLTQNCLFRVRQFLSKNQNYIMMVIKASQQVLEYYAQKNQIAMQTQIGATDLFSFQPVDKYQRPLRLNCYLRDQTFISKYSLRTNKIDKEGQSEEKSIQSEALNLFKKTEKMNPDQLRVKIILDQEDSDECYRWISKELDIGFIQSKNTLTNQHNTQQIDRETWECYYIYNKLVISFVRRLRKIVEAKSESAQNERLLEQINGNLGFLLRIMFIKAIALCNGFFYQHRQNRGFVPNRLKNLFTSKRKLQTIWDKMQVRQPTGYFQYIKNKHFQKVWRKYQVNQKRQRSKFFPAQRLHITNRIIKGYVSIGRSIQKRHIVSYYPLHDPFILKGIKIQPYLLNLKEKIGGKIDQENQENISSVVFNLYTLYQSKQTASDFTKTSIKDKLSVYNSVFKYFSGETVRFYCGQKIAFYFQFMKYLTKKTFPFLIPAMIIQIFFWVQQSHVLQKGQSRLQYLNDALTFIITVANMFWTTNLVQEWKWQERNLAQKFGVAQLTEKDEKRATFVGSYMRNFETDDLNFQYVPKWITILKYIFTTLINLLYVVLVSLVIILIFILKSVLFQFSFSQSTVNAIPSILIAIVVQIFSYLYIYLIRLITQFQNHKTISSFQRSLISKSYIINFVITFISIFIYAFFSSYLDAEYLCQIKTSQTKQIIQNCDYFVSAQLLSLVIVDLIFTLISAFWPFLKFKIQEHYQAKKTKPKTKFYFNKFQSIDQFYQEQDKMHSYMFDGQIDSTWIGYMNLITLFTALALFGPALPFIYVMFFINGVVRLHASKYEIIFLAKRSIPVKANSINWWLIIIEFISVLSIIVNIAYMIYTRQVFLTSQSEIFFFFILAFLMFKFYLMLQYRKKKNMMGQRSRKKVTQLLLKKSDQRINITSKNINTDIFGVTYEQQKLNRIPPIIKKANVRFKQDYYTKN